MVRKTDDAIQDIRAGVLIPTFRHVSRLPGIVANLKVEGLPIIIIDDGNPPEDAAKIAALDAPDGTVTVIRLASNSGKGAAVSKGFERAAQLGWTHAFQIDADGQHDLTCVPKFMELSRAHPSALISGVPVYDETIPRARKIGREITHFWVRVETLSNAITDGLCGFRLYPVGRTLPVLRCEFIGRRMDFDVEMIVHLYWRNVPILEAPVGVTYPDGNVSNFDLLRDNVRISLMHTRLVIQMPFRMPLLWLRQAFRKSR